MRTSCCCKTSNKTFNFIKVFLVLVEKRRDSGGASRHTEYQKVTSCAENYAINTRLDLKITFVWEKKNNIIMNEITWRNILWKTGLDFCVTDNFPGTFIDFSWYLLKKESSRRLIDVLKIFNCKASFKCIVNMPRNCWEKTLNKAVIK